MQENYVTRLGQGGRKRVEGEEGKEASKEKQAEIDDDWNRCLRRRPEPKTACGPCVSLYHTGLIIPAVSIFSIYLGKKR